MRAYAIKATCRKRVDRRIDECEGRFEREIAPLNGVTHDEGPREPDVDKIRSLRTLVEGGRLTAAVDKFAPGRPHESGDQDGLSILA